MSKKLIVLAIGSVLLTTSTICSADSSIMVNTVKPTKIASKTQPVIYSSSKVQYANVATIERLKRAVVILIDKVGKFEKELNAKEIKRADLNKLSAKLSLSTAQTIDNALLNLRRLASENARKIAAIKYGSNNSNVKKASKYDKKIMDFINKENSK